MYILFIIIILQKIYLIQIDKICLSPLLTYVVSMYRRREGESERKKSKQKGKVEKKTRERLKRREENRKIT